jgi:hypothetical protein
LCLGRWTGIGEWRRRGLGRRLGIRGSCAFFCSSFLCLFLFSPLTPFLLLFLSFPFPSSTYLFPFLSFPPRFLPRRRNEYSPERLIQEWELPEAYRVEHAKAPKGGIFSEENPAEGVRRNRTAVTYDDGMSEEQWLQVRCVFLSFSPIFSFLSFLSSCASPRVILTKQVMCIDSRWKKKTPPRPLAASVKPPPPLDTISAPGRNRKGSMTTSKSEEGGVIVMKEVRGGAKRGKRAASMTPSTAEGSRAGGGVRLFFFSSFLPLSFHPSLSPRREMRAAVDSRMKNEH